MCGAGCVDIARHATLVNTVARAHAVDVHFAEEGERTNADL